MKNNFIQALLHLLRTLLSKPIKTDEEKLITDLENQVLLSPPDDRDYSVSAATEMSAETAIPADFEVWQPPVESQGSTGNCVAQSLANIMECISHLYGEEHRDYSVGFIYGAPENTADVGMWPREACNIILKRGDALRKEYESYLENPHCKRLWESKVTPEIEELAKTRKVMAYIRLNNKAEMQAFMYKYNLPVMIVAPTTAYYRSGSGRHATVCYGWISEETYNNNKKKYNDWTESDVGYEDLLFTNSWGTYFHNGDGRGACKSENIEEMWGIVPMEQIKLTDIQGHWAQKDIEYLVELGLIKGYEDNTFRPENTMTRAEVATLIARIVRQMEENK